VTQRFHVIFDEGSRRYFVNDAAVSRIRLHYEVQIASRTKNQKLRDTDLWAVSLEAALAEIKEHFPDYTYEGEWGSPPDFHLRGARNGSRSCAMTLQWTIPTSA
jgi:hypothetical protein